MTGPALEAAWLGLAHQPDCPGGDRVEVFDGIRPGKAGPPTRFEAVSSSTGKPTGRTFERGPARLSPPQAMRVARCLDCGAQVVAATP